MINKTISHYKILSEIGSGGMGIVYKAEDTNLKRHVALKFLPPELTRDTEARGRFIHEAQSASALDHPNVCTVYEIGKTDDGQMFIAMGYYEGETLKQKIEKQSFQFDEAIEIIKQIGKGLSKAHEKGIVHRDIKPANIIISKDGNVKIVDFGLAKLSGMTKLTKASSTLGTIAYMSPEQTRGDEVDHRTDIWSLGVLFYEMLSGLLPFRGDYEQAVMYSILNEEPEPLSNYKKEMSFGFQNIINKALSKDLETRYQGVDELITELENLKQQMSQSVAIGPEKQTIFSRKIVFPGILMLLLFAAYIIFPRFFVKEKSGISNMFSKETQSLAIMNFDYLGNDSEKKSQAAILPFTLTHLLSQVPNLKIPSAFSIEYALKKDGSSKNYNKIASDFNTEIMLLGKMLDLDNKTLVEFQLLDVATNNLIYTGQVTIDNYLDIANNIASQIVSKLFYNFPENSLLKLQDISTESFDAWFYYTESLKYSHKYEWEPAIENLEKAVSYDSTFAMAYLELGRITAFHNRPWTESKEYFDKALKYSSKSLEHERLAILGLSATVLENIKIV